MRRAVIVVGIVLLGSVVARSDAKLKVPDVRGKTVAEANAIVKQAGFVYEVTPFDIGCDDSAPKHGNGTIRCQSPDPGELADKHALVRVSIQQDFDDSGLIRAKDLATLIGLTVDAAEKKLRDLGYKGEFQVLGYDGVCKKGIVCKVEPDRDLYKKPTEGMPVILYAGR